jgi:anti-sigma regulatory factor (Ser/Thr protein kinase)
MREIALHLLDIAENSVTAQAKRIKIEIQEDLQNDRLKAMVEDDGKGMDPEMVARVIDPFTTSRTTRKVGLGIPLFKAAAEACNGALEIHSTPGIGTCLSVEFQRNHIDRMPLGDIAGTILSLVIAHPEVNWILDYYSQTPEGKAGASFHFDDEPIKETLGEIPLSEPTVLAYLRTTLQEGIASVQQTLN